MATVFVQEIADVIEWTAAADVSSNEGLNIGGKLGIALADAKNGEKVSVRMVGVARLPKATGALTAGAVVDWDLTNDEIVASAGDIVDCAIVTEAAASGDATVLVRLGG